MNEDDNRRIIPRELDERPDAADLGGDNDPYDRSVPEQLEGTRGPKPQAIIVAGIIIGSLVLFVLYAALNKFFVHPGTNASATPVTSIAPAVGFGNGGASIAPIIAADDGTPFPSTLASPTSALPRPSVSPTIASTSAAAEVTPYPVQSPAAQTAASSTSGGSGGGGSSATAAAPNSKMSLEQPSLASTGGAGGANGSAGGSQDALAENDMAGGSRDYYHAVYRNGRVAGVVDEGPAGVSTVQRGGVAAPSRPEGVAEENYGFGASSGGGSPAGSSSGADGSPGGTQFVSQADPGSLNSDESGTPSAVSRRNEAQSFIRTQQGNNSVGPVQKLSAYQLNSGTFIKARLITTVDSDLPGTVIGEVIAPVYDSGTHRIVIIPAGTHIQGTYDSAVLSGSQGGLVCPFNLVDFPNGDEVTIGGQIATDARGAAGFNGGDINRYRGELVTQAAALTVLGGAEAAINPQTNYFSPTIQSSTSQAAGQQIAQLGNRIINRNLDKSPTVIYRPPYQFTIVTTRDLNFGKPYIAR